MILAQDLNNDERYVGHKKVEIYPKSWQKEIMEPYFYASIKVYNWALDRCKHLKKVCGDKYNPSKTSMDKALREYIDENPELQGLEVHTLREAMHDAIDAFDEARYKCMHRSKEKCIKNGMYFYKPRPDVVHIDGDKLYLPGFSKYKNRFIKVSYNTGLNMNDRIVDPYIYKDMHGNYYISYNTIEKVEVLRTSKTCPIGIDLGIINTLTTNVPIDNHYFHHLPEEIESLDKQISYLQSKIDKSANKRKEYCANHRIDYKTFPVPNREQDNRRKLQKLIKYKANLINNFINDFANKVVALNPAWICMEHFVKKDLYRTKSYVDPRMQNVHTYDIRMTIKRKCEKYNIPFFEADQYFPSSQICSRCGMRHKIGDARIYNCGYCGNSIDRDLNAARNLALYPYIYNIMPQDTDKYTIIQLGLNALLPPDEKYMNNAHEYKWYPPINNRTMVIPIHNNMQQNLRQMAYKVDNSKLRYMILSVGAKKIDNTKPRMRVMAEKVKK